MAGGGEDREVIACANKSPGERVVIALELGKRALELYLAAHPEMPPLEARDQLMKRNGFCRRPSRVAEGKQ